jgi:hypothetical protein
MEGGKNLFENGDQLMHHQCSGTFATWNAARET